MSPKREGKAAPYSSFPVLPAPEGAINRIVNQQESKKKLFDEYQAGAFANWRPQRKK